MSLNMNCLRSRRDVSTATPKIIHKSGKHKARCVGGGDVVEENRLV